MDFLFGIEFAILFDFAVPLNTGAKNIGGGAALFVAGGDGALKIIGLKQGDQLFEEDLN